MPIGLQCEIQHHQNRWIIIILIICAAVANGDLLWKPENKCVANRNPDTVILKCKSTLDYRLNWLIKTNKSSTELLIFNGYRVSGNVTSYCNVVNGEPGKYDLNLTTTAKAAKQYICLEPGTLMKASAELIVIESHPQCIVTNGGEFTTFTCHIRLYGNWVPVMECRYGNSGEVIGERVYNISTPDEGLTSRLTMLTNQTQDPNIFYMCTTKFRIQEKPSDTTADNVPQYTYLWNSTTYAHSTEGYKGDGGETRGTSEAPAEKQADIKPKVIASVVISTVVLAAAVFLGLLYYKKRKTSKSTKGILKEETTGFI